MKHEEDKGIAWIREVRHKISAEFDHDPVKLGEHYRDLEKKYADRLEPMTTRDSVSEVVTK
jgi:hypothetical protein